MASKRKKSVARKVKKRAESFADILAAVFTSSPSDIVSALREDHDGLRNYLGTLKDPDKPMSERRRAYSQFSALLKSHTIAEEKAVYGEATRRLTGRELHVKLPEGYVEHHVADDLMRRMDRKLESMEWTAHANVLAESVEHHLKEEERDLFPLIDDAASPGQNESMFEKFVSLRRKTQKKVSKKNAGVLKSV